MTEDDDGFVELRPRASGAGAAKPAVAVSTIQLKSAPAKLSLSVSPEAIAGLGDGRITVAWNERSSTLRIRADTAGLFEFRRHPKSGRAILRLPLPSGLVFRKDQTEPCPRRQEGATLFLVVPPAFRKPPDPKTAIAAAREAVPAPGFGSKRPG